MKLLPITALALVALSACGGSAPARPEAGRPSVSTAPAPRGTSALPGSSGAPGTAGAVPSGVASATAGMGAGAGVPGGQPASGTAPGKSGAPGAATALRDLLPTAAEMGTGWTADPVAETEGNGGFANEYCRGAFGSDRDRTSRATVLLRSALPSHGVFAQATRYSGDNAGDAVEDFRDAFRDCRSYRAGDTKVTGYDLRADGADAILYEIVQSGRTAWSAVVVRRVGDVVLTASVFGEDRLGVETGAARAAHVYAGRG